MASFAEAVNEALAAESPEGEQPAAEVESTEGVTEPVEATEVPTEVVEDTAPEPERHKYVANGIEHEATLDELRQLASAGQDYTRKTQELAAERQRLAEAEALYEKLSEDPETIVRKLAEAYGIELPEAAEVDPEEARIRALEQSVAADHQAREQEAAMRRIDTSLAALHETYGEFEDESLFAYAIEHEITDLTTAYRDMKFDEIRTEALAAREAQRAKETEGRVDAKRDASVVSGGESTQDGEAQVDLPERPTVRQALMAAYGKK